MQKIKGGTYEFGNSFFLEQDIIFRKKGNTINYFREKLFCTSNSYFLRKLLDQKNNTKRKKKRFFPQKFVFFLNLKFKKNQLDNNYLFLKFLEESFGPRYIFLMYFYLRKISRLAKNFLFCQNDFRILQYYKKKKMFFLDKLYFSLDVLEKCKFDTDFFRKNYKNYMELFYWDMKFVRNCENFKNLIFLLKKNKKQKYTMTFFF
jgi:hypothetical protein